MIDRYDYHLVPIALGQVHLLKSVHMILFIVDYMFMEFKSTLVCAIYIQLLDVTSY